MCSRAATTTGGRRPLFSTGSSDLGVVPVDISSSLRYSRGKCPHLLLATVGARFPRMNQKDLVAMTYGVVEDAGF